METRTVADAAILEKYQQLDEKLYMTIEEAISLSQELARRLQQQPPRPELVVGIADGALLIARIVADSMSLPMHALRIRRRGTSLKKKLALVPGVHGVVAKLYTFALSVPLLQTPLRAVMRRLGRLEKTRSSQELPVRGKRVALIDDCVESGQTLQAAVQLLLQAGAESVQTACISWSSQYKARADAVGTWPDIYINRRIQHYPWSSNSPHWAQYHAELARRGIELQAP